MIYIVIASVVTELNTKLSFTSVLAVKAAVQMHITLHTKKIFEPQLLSQQFFFFFFDNRPRFDELSEQTTLETNNTNKRLKLVYCAVYLEKNKTKQKTLPFFP